MSILLIENELISDPSRGSSKGRVQKLNRNCLKLIIELEEQRFLELEIISKKNTK
jgi:hypothetical protein